MRSSPEQVAESVLAYMADVRNFAALVPLKHILKVAPCLYKQMQFELKAFAKKKDKDNYTVG
jgi:hypothetical protein